MCSMLSTVVVKLRSNRDVTWLSMPSGDIPAKFQRTETTGILMEGKMSFGLRTMATTPAIRMRIAKTVNVYGRLSARATIHMGAIGFGKTSASGRRDSTVAGGGSKPTDWSRD